MLRQNRSRPGTQAEILRRIQTFRVDTLHDSTLALPLAKRAAPPAFERVVDFVEWKLVEMPLPRLQTIGGQQDPFLYRIGWTDGVRRAPIADYQSGRTYDFDNRIRLFPGVAAQLVALNGLLRPLIQRQWAQDVARINRLPEARLHAFLFGAARMPTRAIRTALVDLQHGRCFYCAQPVGGGRAFDVDHFIPWSRHPDDGIENLVVADRSCNGHKRAHLAATAHVLRWVERNAGAQRADLDIIARDAGWESRPERTLGAASSIYLRLPDDFALWIGRDRFERPERAALQRVFATAR